MYVDEVGNCRAIMLLSMNQEMAPNVQEVHVEYEVEHGALEVLLVEDEANCKTFWMLCHHWIGNAQ